MIKTIKRVLILFIISFLMSPFLSISKVNAEKEEINLFNNPSFESGCIQYDFSPSAKTTNWKQVSWSNVDNGLGFARTGSANAFMTFCYEGLGLNEFPTMYQDVKVEKETLYIFSFYAKRWGEAPSQPLYVGTRDRQAADPWASIDLTVIADLTSEEYTKVSAIFYSYQYSEMRFAVHTQSVSYNGQPGGYHLDDFCLTKISEYDSATINISDDIEIGKSIKYETIIKLKDGTTISDKQTNSITTIFESSNETIVCTNLNGEAIPLKVGKASLDIYVLFGGKKINVGTKEIEILEEHIPSTSYIKQIALNMPDPLINTNYSEIYASLIMSDGSSINNDEVELSIQSSDNTICFAETQGKKLQAIGVSGGNATLYVTAKYNELCCVGKMNVIVEKSNYLKDPSFECYESNPVWTFEANCGIGIDSGLLNGLSHTGYSNVWMMAPIYWDANCQNASTVDIYQIVHLDKGQYELSAYINRFYATGVEGTLASIGGLVKIGATQLDNPDNNQYAEFDVSYGFGGFQKLSTLITIDEPGDFKVYFNVEGDETFGLGMQLDDMYLVDAIFPESIKAYLLDDNFGIDDLAQLVVEANYKDGSTKMITNGFRIIPDDYSILYESGGFLIGRNNGTTNVKVKVEILQRVYETEIIIKVGTGIKDVTEKNMKNTSGIKNAIIVSSTVLLSAGIITTVLIVRKKRGDIK